MKKILLNCAFIFLLIQFNYAQQSIEKQIKETEDEYNETKNKSLLLKEKLLSLKLQWIQKELINIGLPQYSQEEIIVHHSAYSFSYDTLHKQAKWVAHIIPPEVIEGNLGRTNDFRPDSLLNVQQASIDDYWESGYDRGHLAPSADFRWSAKAVSESYFYSNMSPQKPDFNRGIWSYLEDALRKYVVNSGRRLFVVTGGVLKPNLPIIGKNKVSVPELYFKVAIDIDSTEKMGIGFLLPNAESDEHIMYYALSIDSIEKITGIDFFPNLHDDIEQKVESQTNIDIWQKIIDKDEAIPIPKSKLPRNCFNSTHAKSLVGKHTTICGKVVSTKFSIKSGNTFLNLDKKFPNQIFSITIWKADRMNFTYKPEEFLKDKIICVRGDIKLFREIPTMSIKSERDIILLDDE